MKIIHLICAARPNFIKIAPIHNILKDESWCDVKIIHTGQHYDPKMSQTFFDDFNLSVADYYLNVGSGSHAEQKAQTMITYENLCLGVTQPDLTIVVGDVNATLACSIVAKKLHIPVAHLEAGLRSFDRTMPEEINRIATDSITDYFWTPSEDANENLKREGVHSERIYWVGNVMIDTYCMMKNKIEQSAKYQSFNLEKKNYIVLTLHRPINVDDSKTLEAIMQIMHEIDKTIIFPVHPRTRKNLEKIRYLPKNITLCEPLGYIDFMSLVSNAAFVISDSGGIQEETTYLGIPCFTLRETTERPITVTLGSNQLVSVDNLLDKIKLPKTGRIPPLWDGKTSERILTSIKEILQ